MTRLEQKKNWLQTYKLICDDNFQKTEKLAAHYKLFFRLFDRQDADLTPSQLRAKYGLQ